MNINNLNAYEKEIVNNNYANFMKHMYGENKNAFQNDAKFNCEAEGFDDKMKQASGGLEYQKRADFIHMNGEQWSYDKLVDFAIDGRIIDWYIKKLKEQGIRFTNQDEGRVKSNPTVQLLAAFYHRYKIVAERLILARDLFDSGVGALLPFLNKKTKGKNSYNNLIKNKAIKPNLYPMEKIMRLADFAAKKIRINEINTEIETWDFPIETAIDRAQCLMFYIVKHKGELPPGFVMDDRIMKRAYNPIVLNWHLLDEGYMGPYKDIPPEKRAEMRLDVLIQWLSFLESEAKELGVPPVTFGVF